MHRLILDEALRDDGHSSMWYDFFSHGSQNWLFPACAFRQHSKADPGSSLRCDIAGHSGSYQGTAIASLVGLFPLDGLFSFKPRPDPVNRMRAVLLTRAAMSLRIAIAGGGGFAYLLAREIAQSTNALLLLSTRVSTTEMPFRRISICPSP